MASQQYKNWLAHGRPDSGLARPLAQLRDVLRSAGYTVYDFPNDEHLNAVPPEDHTYYSETGWPGPSPKWWRHAIDIMPKSGKDGPGLQALGARMVADRNAGKITWLKYINWPSEGRLDRAVQDGWKPTHYQRSSSDTGHIHISSITGCETLDAPYNPLVSAAKSGGLMAVTDLYAKLMYEKWAPTKDEWIKAGGAPEVYDQLAQNGSGVNNLALAIDDINAKLDKILDIVSTFANTPSTGGQPAPGADVVVSALQSAEGQAALIRAANAAEDS